MGWLRAGLAPRARNGAPGRGKRPGALFADEDGFTTVGVAVALLLTCALLFSAAQLYRLNSLSADVQDVADAAALAAENEVAEFMVAVHVCDAVVLSLSLLSLTLSALGVVAACVPPAAMLSAKLLDLGRQTMDARDSFAGKAEAGLNKLQKALPVLAAGNAATVASGNDGGVGGDDYLALALLVPSVGEDIGVEAAEGERAAQQEAEEGAEVLRQKAQEAEELAEEAAEQKKKAFMADCGNAPGRCQQERAERLAALPAQQNPQFSTVDAWSFSVALERARAYYAARALQGVPAAGSAEERGDAALRQRFYAYACEQLAEGYVHEDGASFEASFPLLFKNMAELRETPLYTESAYPITLAEDGSHRVMHAWAGCPAAAGAVGSGSVSQLEAEAESFQRCPSCEFRPSSLGNVAAASSAIDNGFEYHYRIIAEAAREYERASAEMEPLKEEVQQKSGSLIDQLLGAVEEAASKRITAAPPGSKGAIALVLNTVSTPTDAGFESGFAPAGELGARAAVAGATLMADPADDAGTVITGLLDGFGEDGGAAVGAGRLALDGWSALLRVYGEGQDSLLEAVEKGLNGIPLQSLAGLGTQAAGKLRDGLEAVGLEPAKLDSLKPVLVNSEPVAAAGDDAVLARFHEVQQRVRDAAGESTELFNDVVEAVQGSAYEQLDRVEEGVKVAELDLPFSSEPFPIVVKLPESLLNGARDLVDRCGQGMRSAYATITGRRVWA